MSANNNNVDTPLPSTNSTNDTESITVNHGIISSSEIRNESNGNDGKEDASPEGTPTIQKPDTSPNGNKNYDNGDEVKAEVAEPATILLENATPQNANDDTVVTVLQGEIISEVENSNDNTPTSIIVQIHNNDANTDSEKDPKTPHKTHKKHKGPPKDDPLLPHRQNNKNHLIPSSNNGNCPNNNPCQSPAEKREKARKDLSTPLRISMPESTSTMAFLIDEGVGDEIADVSKIPSKINANHDCFFEPNWCCCCNRCCQLRNLVGFIGFFDVFLFTGLAFLAAFLLCFWQINMKYAEKNGLQHERVEWWQRVMQNNEDAFILLITSYSVSAMSGWVLGIRYKRMKRCPGVWWMLSCIYTTVLIIVTLILFKFDENYMANMGVIVLRIYEFWVVFTWDRYLKGRKRQRAAFRVEHCPNKIKDYDEEVMGMRELKARVEYQQKQKKLNN